MHKILYDIVRPLVFFRAYIATFYLEVEILKDFLRRRSCSFAIIFNDERKYGNAAIMMEVQ